MAGVFITFEGVDGCGKSTQIRMLGEFLTELNISYILTREPGGSPISEKIRAMLLDVENSEMSAATEALLYAASRAQHIDDTILPALAQNKVVLCDRYIDSSLAYQAYGRGLGEKAVLSINAYAVENCMPDVTFFLDCTPADARQRMRRRTEKDRVEMSGDTFFERTYNGFISSVEKYPDRVKRIDASGTKFETQQQLRDILKKVLQSKGII